VNQLTLKSVFTEHVSLTMKQVTLNIPEEQFPFFMQLVRSLNFVQLADNELSETKLTAPQQETWQSIKAGFDELKDVESGKRQARPVQELFNELGI
jgi:hypothetical protein